MLTALPIVCGSTKLIRDDSSCRLIITRGKSPRRRFLTLATECGEIAGSFPLGGTGLRRYSGRDAGASRPPHGLRRSRVGDRPLRAKPWPNHRARLCPRPEAGGDRAGSRIEPRQLRSVTIGHAQKMGLACHSAFPCAVRHRSGFCGCPSDQGGERNRTIEGVLDPLQSASAPTQA